MTYEEFQKLNDKAKKKANIRHRISDNITAEQTKCVLDNDINIEIKTLIFNIQQCQMYVTNPSKLANWKGFDKAKEQKKSKSKILDFTTLLDDVEVNGYLGNIEKPVLVLNKIDTVKKEIELKTCVDYSARYYSFNTEQVKENIKGLNCKYVQSSVTSTEVKVRLKLPTTEVSLLVSELYKLVLSDAQTTYRTQFITVTKNNLSTNIGRCAYTVVYSRETFRFNVSVLCRYETNRINDFQHMAKQYDLINAVRELGIKDNILARIRSEQNYTLVDKFDYKVISDSIVIVSLKKEYTPLDLLEYEGFGTNYISFKVECPKGLTDSGTFWMVKSDLTSWNVTWGNSTTMTSKDVWKMRDAIIKCIKLKCGMFLSRY